MFTKVKIDDFQTYWPISQVQANCHNSFSPSPLNFRSYYLRILPRFGTVSKGEFCNILNDINAKDLISSWDVCHCDDFWVFIFDECGGGVNAIMDELKHRMQSYDGLPLPDLELVHPVNKFVVFSLGVFSGDWQYNKLIEREV